MAKLYPRIQKDTLARKSHKKCMGAIQKTKVGCHSSETKEDRNKLERPDDAGQYTNQPLYQTFFHKLSNQKATANI
jgi:hypothetical protein